uniref:Rac GTPase-activating protein 1 n=1 Tax=Timema cristinae TaxID=61476 RepID=A0A7R9H182_TIMCR|nr:unnamed protein product [Timema cristinae]
MYNTLKYGVQPYLKGVQNVIDCLLTWVLFSTAAAPRRHTMTTTNGNAPHFFLTPAYKDLARRTSVLTNSCEQEFLRFAINQEECRQHWLQSVREVDKLKQALEKSQSDVSALESRLRVARRYLDDEKKRRRLIESERESLEKQLELVRDVVLHGNAKFLNEETKEKLAFLNNTSVRSRRSNGADGNSRYETGGQRLDTISEGMDSTVSILSDLSYSRSEDDLDLSLLRAGKQWRRYRHSNNKDDSPSVKRAKRAGNKSIELEAGAGERVVATTTVTMNSGGPIKASSKLETILPQQSRMEEDAPFTHFLPSAPFQGSTESVVSSMFTGSVQNYPQHDYLQNQPEMSPKTDLMSMAIKNKIHSRPHVFVTKTTIRPETCGPCNRRIKFGKVALRCQDCRTSCHNECKDKVPLPCVPLGNTPNKKGGMVSTSLLFISRTLLIGHSLPLLLHTPHWSLVASPPPHSSLVTRCLSSSTLLIGHSLPLLLHTPHWSLAASPPKHSSLYSLQTSVRRPPECYWGNVEWCMGVIGDYAPTMSPMIPSILVHCIQEVELRGLKEVGIYRISTSDREVKALKEKFLRGKGVPNLSSLDIHTICGTIKDFLRFLREPLVTYLLWPDFVRASEMASQEDGKAAIYQAIAELPQPNRDTLAFVILHLQSSVWHTLKLASRAAAQFARPLAIPCIEVMESPEVKMPIDNIAKVFGPTLVGYSSNDPTPITILNETKKQTAVMQFLLRIPEDYWMRFTNSGGINQAASELRHTPSSITLTRNGSNTSTYRGIFNTPLGSSRCGKARYNCTGQRELAQYMYSLNLEGGGRIFSVIVPWCNLCHRNHPWQIRKLVILLKIRFPRRLKLTREPDLGLAILTRDIALSQAILTRDIAVSQTILTRDIAVYQAILTRDIAVSQTIPTRDIAVSQTIPTRDIARHSGVFGYTRQRHSGVFGYTRQIHSGVFGYTRQIHSGVLGYTRQRHSGVFGYTRQRHSGVLVTQKFRDCVT